VVQGVQTNKLVLLELLLVVLVVVVVQVSLVVLKQQHLEGQAQTL